MFLEQSISKKAMTILSQNLNPAVLSYLSNLRLIYCHLNESLSDKMVDQMFPIIQTNTQLEISDPQV